MKRRLAGLAAAVGGVLFATSVGFAPAAGGTSERTVLELPNGAPDISTAAVREHLVQLQTIADDNGGNRATGSPGYQASVDYVQQEANSYGYEVETQEFSSRAGDSANVLATLEGQDPATVVLIGAHLDSVASGPGVNDNGTGSAALLAVADAYAQANPDPPVTVRFAWWGAEEQGLVGSGYYVDQLRGAELDKIDAYLNFDMIGSPNAGYFVYSNDSQLRGVLDGYFGTMDVPTESTDLGGRSDHANFASAGVDVAGLFTGAEGTKSQEQARRWGGTAGEAFDPCYHSSCDTIDNINETALERNVDAISYSVWELASN